ncbi:hypothetical protein MalM25_24370 [Planctomycetes bacterium MalM25]|nr:hypothetical protein MalM25_24370 [Planctomycetes bacterium MalM25]
MADFRTHVTFSSAIGAGYAVVATGAGFDLAPSLVAGGLCGVAGMLPDVDSDSGVPRREAMGFAAAIIPMLLVSRLRDLQLEHDVIVLTAAGLYFLIRFVAADLIGRWSVHRGMWHSIPAVLIFAGLAFLISSPTDVFERYLKAAAVGLGSFSHLLLDEIYSVDTRGVVPRFKKSFGSAIKFWGKKGWANFSTYAKLAAVVLAISMDSMVLDRLELRNPEAAERLRVASERLDGVKDRFAIRPRESEPTEAVANALSSAAPRQETPRSAPAPTRPATPPPIFRRPDNSRWFAPPRERRDHEFMPNNSQAPPGWR